MNDGKCKKSISSMCYLFYVASFLVLSVGISLYLLSAKTDVYFSWTINPPLTAAHTVFIVSVLLVGILGIWKASRIDLELHDEQN